MMDASNTMSDHCSKESAPLQTASRSLAIVCTLGTVATTIACFTCIRIEILNHQVGSFLPRQQVDGRITKWRGTSERVFRESTEQRIRQDRLCHYADGEHPTDRQMQFILGTPLTDKETATLAALCRQNQLESSLYAWVSTLGLLQYLLLPFAAGCAIWCTFHVRGIWQRVYWLALVAACGLCSVMLIYRGYFSSLGF